MLVCYSSARSVHFLRRSYENIAPAGIRPVAKRFNGRIPHSMYLIPEREKFPVPVPFQQNQRSDRRDQLRYRKGNPDPHSAQHTGQHKSQRNRDHQLPQQGNRGETLPPFPTPRTRGKHYADCGYQKAQGNHPQRQSLRRKQFRIRLEQLAEFLPESQETELSRSA